MTTSNVEISVPSEADYELTALGAALVASAKRDRDRIAAQALADERTILALPAVQAVLGVRCDGRRPVANWEGMLGRLYTLPLDEQQRSFLGLVLSMLGIGSTTLAAVSSLSGERLRIITQAILRLAGDDSIAVATRL